MADGTVAIVQSTVPVKQVDTDALVNDAGTTVHRQRTENPELMELLRSIRNLLRPLGSVIKARGTTNAPMPALQVTTMLGVDATGLPIPNELMASFTSTTTVTSVTTLNSLACATPGTLGNNVPLGLTSPSIVGQIPAVWMLNMLAEAQRGSVAVT